MGGKTIQYRNCSDWGLTPKQMLVCNFIVQGVKFTEAMKRAGYAHETVSKQNKERFFRNRSVIEYIRYKMDELASASGVTTQWLIEQIKDEIAKTDDPMAKVKYFEMLNKIVMPAGINFTPIAAENNGTINVNYSISRKPEESTEGLQSIPESIQDSDQQ